MATSRERGRDTSRQRRRNSPALADRRGLARGAGQRLLDLTAVLALALGATTVHAQPAAAATAAELSPAAARTLQQRRQLDQRVRIETVPATVSRPEATSPAGPATVPASPEATPPPPALEHARRVELDAAAARASDGIVRSRILRANPVLGPNAVVLPGAITAPTTSGTTVDFRHVAMPGRPLEYDPETGEFAGNLQVGVVAFGGDATATLKEPVTFQLLEAGSTEGSTVVVSTLAPPFTPIPIKVSNPQPPVTLRVASGTDQPSEEVGLPIKPTLFVWPASNVILGDGLGETELLVVALTDQGSAGQKVQLTAEPQAKFSNAVVQLDEHGVASTVMTSVGSGAVTVGARAPGYTTVPTRVTYEAVARKLALSADSESIEGYGVGATMLTIVATARDLRPGQIVMLDASRASIEQPDDGVRLDGDGRATVKLRSQGVGTARVVASAPGFEPAVKDITFDPPVETIGASLAGGVLGGVGRALARRRRTTRASTLASGLALSVVVGIIVVALFAIGIDVLPVAPKQTTGAVVVFALAALGAFIGVSALPGASQAKG